MAQARLTITSEPTIYHVVTRTSRGAFLFGDVEKDRLRKMLWQMADFCGVEVLTYAIMSNHLHIVVGVPVKESVTGASGVDGADGIAAVPGADALVSNAVFRQKDRIKTLMALTMLEAATATSTEYCIPYSIPPLIRRRKCANVANQQVL